MKPILRALLLPAEITAFERNYLELINRVALWFFALHVPFLIGVAALNDTRPLEALALSLAVLVGPVVAIHTLENPRVISTIHGVTAMFMGGLLVHFGQGPMQIEMHFYFFALIGMCAAFGNPTVIVAAAVTVILHHLVVWSVLPSSVFNYDASIWVVAVHGGFVVLESIGSCFIARSFFDNVIGLEKIVEARTVALDSKNRDLRLLLDNVQQGFLTIDREGRLVADQSAAVGAWFGPRPEHDATWFDYLERLSPEVASASRFAWDEVVADVMPLELTLDQMPHRLDIEGRALRVEYQPITSDTERRFLVIVTDVTSQIEREAADTERREVMAVLEHLLQDRLGVESFFEETSILIDTLILQREGSLSMVKRMIHTLKGNAALYGLASISDICHSLEDGIAQEQRAPILNEYAPLLSRWTCLAKDIDKLVGNRARSIQMSDKEYDSLLLAVRTGAPSGSLVNRVRNLKLEPARARLAHFGQQAQRIATKLGKDGLDVVVEDNGVRLDARKWGGVWAAFTHAVRNAVDHGIEAPEQRLAAGKSRNATLVLRTAEEGGRLVIEVRDDGRGIDWEQVRVRAGKAGLPSETRSDLEKALFVDGVSTVAVASDISGRGVGMGALLHEVHALGGELVLDSRPGEGTRIRMSFPLLQNEEPAPVAA
ncbi:MAG: ATP-binding protein [Polyangiaceae bacterium]